MFVFVYWLLGYPRCEPSSEIHVFRNEYYALLYVSASQYAAHARRRSPKWDTVTVPAGDFRKLIRPIDEA